MSPQMEELMCLLINEGELDFDNLSYLAVPATVISCHIRKLAPTTHPRAASQASVGSKATKSEQKSGVSSSIKKLTPDLHS